MIGGDGMAESFLTLMAEYGDADQKKISLWYDALQDAGFRGTQTPDLRHHISLATFPLNQEAEAVRLMQDVAGRFAPRQADIRHMGVMPGGKVLFDRNTAETAPGWLSVAPMGFCVLEEG